jgi:acyl carrier protein
MGHKGNICFAAASFFIDEISRGNTVPGTRITEVKWPGWSATGLASDGETTQGISAIRIMTTDALEMADLILQTGAGHLVVSENNLELLEANPYFSTNNKKTPPVPGAAATIAVDAETAVEMKSVAAELPGLTATERRIYQVWKDVLKLDTIGVNDDFFEIGGHSLNGGQIINKIAKEFNVEIDFEVLFDYSTISTLALYIEELQGIGDSAEEDNKLVAVSSSEHYAVSPAQKRLWILQQLDRRSSAYNMSASYEFDGALDVPAFLKAYTLLIKRHESLRTTFITAEGEPRQKINTFTELQFGLRYDESLLNDADNEARLLQMILEDAQKPFDLEKGPLIRGTLVRSQESRYIFFFSVHHIIGDGWSLNVIQQEMKMLYDACVKGIEAPLVPLKLHYKDFTAWHTAHLGDESVQEAAQYWRQQFSGVVPAVRLPLSFPRPVNKSYAAKRLTLQLNQDISLMVKEFSKKNEATSFMTVLSLVKILLFTCTGQDDLVIGTPVSGRNHEELENQVGLYLNTLAIRTKFKKEDSCTQLAERVKENTIRALKYQAYPFDRLLEDLDIIPPAGRNPLFDIGFTYNSFTGVNVPAATAEEDSFDTIAISRLDHGNATVKGDLWFLVYDGYDSLKINLDYNTALFSENFAAGFMEDFKFIIHTVLEKPALPLAGISELVAENNQRIQQEKQNKLRKKNSNALKERFRK